MTREEAIRMIERIKDRINWEVVDSQKKMDALNMAIKSLEAWEKVKKEIDEATEMLPDGDFYIKNFDVKRIIDKYYFSEVEE